MIERETFKEQFNVVKSEDLCIPIYLNQQAVFDMLASLEDGFSIIRTITTSSSETQVQESGVGGSLGLSNVFAFLGVKFGGQRAKGKSSEERAEATEERVHTPTSLFIRLRKSICENGLLVQLNSTTTFEKLKFGDFVEFRAVLRNNPLVDVLSSMKRMIELYTPFIGKFAGSSDDKTRKEKRTNEREMISLLDVILKDLIPCGAPEIIAECVDIPEVKAVLSVRLDYFLDRAVSEVFDGHFFVFGKVVKVVESNKGNINLLRKTSFGLLKLEQLAQFISLLTKIQEIGLQLPDIVTEIPGPALQVLPIAIFV